MRFVEKMEKQGDQTITEVKRFASLVLQKLKEDKSSKKEG